MVMAHVTTHQRRLVTLADNENSTVTKGAHGLGTAVRVALRERFFAASEVNGW